MKISTVLEQLIKAATPDAIEELKSFENNDRWINTTDACKYLNVSRTMFYNKIKPLLKSKKKSGGQVQYLLSDLDKYVHNNSK